MSNEIGIIPVKTIPTIFRAVTLIAVKTFRRCRGVRGGDRGVGVTRPRRACAPILYSRCHPVTKIIIIINNDRSYGSVVADQASVSHGEKKIN